MAFGESVRKALLVTAVVVATLGVIVGAVWGGLEGSDRLWPVTWVVWAPVGALILWKRPGNGVGRTMVGIGLGFGMSFLCLAFAYGSIASLEVRVWVELVNAVLGVIPWLGIMWLLLIFPTGRLVGRWDRLAGLGVGLLGVLGVLAFVFSPTPMEATGEPSPLSSERAAVFSEWFVGEGGFSFVVGVTSVAVVSLAARFRSSSNVERHQYRWLLFGALIFLVITGLGQILPEDSAGMYLWLLAGSAIPLAVGVAITRYRLFEIDRLLSRTVTYGLVVGVLAVAVAGVAALAGSRFQVPWVVAATTLGVAAMFNPLRKRVQSLVDRRFNRSKYDAERVMDEFTGSLRDRVDADSVVEGWLGVVDSTMQPASVGVWVRN